MLEDLEDCETVEGSYLGMINVDEVIYDPWKVDVKANREGMNFKLDLGADVIVIPKRMVPKNTVLCSVNKLIHWIGYV